MDLAKVPVEAHHIRARRSPGSGPGGVVLAFALLLGVGACGRVGYDPVLVGHSEREAGDASDVAPPHEGGVVDMSRGPEPTLDGLPPPVDGPIAEPSPDGPAPPIDQRLVDMATPVDTVPPPIDTALPPDASPDTADTVSGQACPVFPPNDIIVDFEDRTLELKQVGARGGTTLHLVNVANGTIANVAQSVCGQRSMQIQGGPPPRVPLVQGTFSPIMAATYDARGFSGIAITVRATRATAVRLKLPNDDTVGGGNDHFQVSLTVGPTWSHLSFPWSAFAQMGAATQFPRFDVSTLFAVEISASVAADVTVFVDQIAFVR